MSGADGHAADRSAPSTTLLVTTEMRAMTTPDGVIWASPGFAYGHWTADAGGFLRVEVALRVQPVGQRPAGSERLDGPRVAVLALPPLRLDRRLPGQLAEAARRFAAADRDGDTALLLTLPGVVGSLGLVHAVLRRRPFAVQVVGDPLDVTGRAGIGGRARRAIGAALAAAQWLACRRAVAARYVSDGYLQQRYPPGPDTSSHAVSNVLLAPGSPPTVAAGSARSARAGRTPLRLVTVASLEQPYKRVDLLLDAVAVLRGQGWDLALDVVGDGRLRPTLQAQALQLGLADHVTFHGAVPRPRVDELLATADLFVLCSDTEGMPRALIEAMAAGLPCVASSVGGVPELLAPEDRFEPGSLASLVGALRRQVVSGRLRRRSARRARARGDDFAPAALAPALRKFLGEVAERATRPQRGAG